MSIRLMTDILDGGALDLTLAQRFLLVILADFADDDGTCWPKVSTLAKRLNVKERQTQKHLATLQQKGYIEIVQKSKGHSSNVYRIRGVDNDTCRKVHLSKSTPVREDTPRPVREDTPPILYKEPSIEPPINTPNPSRGNDCPYDLILETFHSCCPSLPEPRGLPDHRKKVMQARWKEHNDIAIFQEAFKNIEASDFHSGRNGKWKQCNLDWILKPNNFTKALEMQQQPAVEIEATLAEPVGWHSFSMEQYPQLRDRLETELQHWEDLTPSMQEIVTEDMRKSQTQE